jgi:hypothetical protein
MDEKALSSSLAVSTPGPKRNAPRKFSGITKEIPIADDYVEGRESGNTDRPILNSERYSA